MSARRACVRKRRRDAVERSPLFRLLEAIWDANGRGDQDRVAALVLRAVEELRATSEKGRGLGDSPRGHDGRGRNFRGA